ncbi:ribonuclease H-like domain-containing protein [Tanacetum coccineum]
MDEIVESENLDVTTVVTPSNDKIVENKSVSNTVEANAVRMNNTRKLSTAGAAVNTAKTVNTVNTANTKAVNTVRSVNTAASKPIVNHPKKTNAFKRGYSQSSRPFNRHFVNRNSIINTNDNTTRVKDTTVRDRAVAKHIEYLVGDEVVHKELGDKMERAATTASSFEAEQDSVTSTMPSLNVQPYISLSLNNFGKLLLGAQLRIRFMLSLLPLMEEKRLSLKPPLEDISNSNIRKVHPNTFEQTTKTTFASYQYLFHSYLYKQTIQQHKKSIQGILWVVTPLFDTMLVQPQGEAPSTSHSIITSSPSFLSHYTPPSTPNTPPFQTTHEAEETATMTHDSPLPGGHTPESNEGRLKHDELMELVTKLSDRIVAVEEDLKQTKKTYSNALTKLVLKVKKLEKQVRSVNTAASKPIVNHPRTKTNAFKRGYSQSSRPFNRHFANKNSINVNTARVKNTTARDRAVVSENKGKGANAVKASTCWGNPQQKEYKEKGVIDSGCSRHMTGNKCYLDEYEDYDGGFVSFGDGKGSIQNKDETSGILKTFITEIENQLDHKVKVIRSDNGTEFKNSIMNQFCEIKGIKREFSVARTPQQNGVAERKNRTLIEAARTMLVDSKLPTTFWAEAVNTACYVLNRVLVIKPHNKTPYELIRGRPPLIDFMKPFGCPVTILNTGSEPKITLLQDSEGDARMKPTKVDENEALDKSRKHDQEARSESERINQREMQTEHTNSTNGINTVSTAGPSTDTVGPSNTS